MHPRAHCRKVNWSHFPSFSENDRLYAAEKARALSVSIFGKKIYSRGLVEISNYCRNDCYYCGIEKATAMPSGTGFRGGHPLLLRLGI